MKITDRIGFIIASLWCEGGAVLAREGRVAAGQEQDENSSVLVLRRDFPLLGAYVAPRSPTEQTLVEIFRSAFGMDQVSVNDSFEDLGGDSLIALIICADIEKIFAVSVSITILERSPTIEHLAPRINELISRRKA